VVGETDVSSRDATSRRCALALAESKAAKAAKRYRRGVVIGADQILVCDGEWFDNLRICAKPGRSCNASAAGLTRW
jgi:predicted house-cleaning NTP pyrophosphatase (Maf/HAM1 superfamily)